MHSGALSRTNHAANFLINMLELAVVLELVRQLFGLLWNRAKELQQTDGGGQILARHGHLSNGVVVCKRIERGLRNKVSEMRACHGMTHAESVMMQCASEFGFAPGSSACTFSQY